MLIEPSDVRFESGVNPGKVGHIIKNNQVHVIIQLASAAADQNPAEGSPCGQLIR
jgi:hypothetical protein